MKSKPNEFKSKWVGVVEAFSKEKKVRLTSIQQIRSKDGKGQETKKFPNGDLTLDVSISDLPKIVQKLIKPNMEKRRFRVRLDMDGECIETVTPVNGMFKAKLVGLGPKDQNGNYKLIHKVYNEGKENENSHDEFIAIYEIQEGPFKGMELPGYYLHYKFEEVPEGEEDEGFTRFNCADTPQATQFHRLLEWGSVHGDIFDADIKWPDDGIILETLEERALDADREVNLIFENGYISSVQSVEDYGSDDDEDESEEEFDEKFPEKEEVVEVPAKGKKAPVKKVAKKSSDEDDSDL